MILKNQVEWALHCCSVMAGIPDGQYVSAKALSEFHGVPKEYLAKALQALSQAGLVEGTLGPKGGYRLAKKPNEITFLDVVEAIEGRRNTFNCTEIRGNNPCVKDQSKIPDRPCLIAGLMWQADEAWRDKLRSVTMQDVLEALVKELPAEDLEESRDWLLSYR